MKTTFTLVGNVASIKHFPGLEGKKSVTKVTVAHNYGSKDKKGVEFFPLTAFEHTATFVDQYFKVGSAIIATVTPGMSKEPQAKWATPSYTLTHADFAPANNKKDVEPVKLGL
jgi:hypothetical protein